MSTFQLDGKEIYYEEHGEGAPLIVVNGIFMTTASWSAFIPMLSKNNRLILFDLLDQGKSAMLDHEYDNGSQIEALRGLIEHLGLPKASVMGISYGGEVALQFALEYPQLLDKLVLANTTSYTCPWLLDIGNSWEYAVKTHDGELFFKTCIPIIYSPGFYNKNIGWMRARGEMFKSAFTPEVYDAFGRLIRSAEKYDIRERLGEIKHETLIISSEFDYVTPIPEQNFLAAHIDGAAHVSVPDAGHAVMYEKPKEFFSVILGFVNS